MGPTVTADPAILNANALGHLPQLAGLPITLTLCDGRIPNDA